MAQITAHMILPYDEWFRIGQEQGWIGEPFFYDTEEPEPAELKPRGTHIERECVQLFDPDFWE